MAAEEGLAIPQAAGFNYEAMARLCHEANRTFLFCHGYFDLEWSALEDVRRDYLKASVAVLTRDPSMTPESLHEAQLVTLRTMGFSWGIRTSWEDQVVDFLLEWSDLPPSLRFQAETMVAMMGVVRRLEVEVQED